LKEVKLFAIILAFYLATIPNVFADHYYVGGYFAVSKSTANKKVIFATNFPNTTPSVIPSYLQSVLSVAGWYSGNTPSAWLYQSDIELAKNGSVIFFPQAYYQGGTTPHFSPVLVGTVSSVMFYGEIVVQTGGNIFFKAFVYNTQSQWNSNTPTIYTYSYLTGDNGLLYGTETIPYTNLVCKYLQCGVESAQLISSSQWRVFQKDFAYYGGDLNWHYVPAKSVEGTSSYITWYISGSYLYYFRVGGLDFTGVTVEIPSSDNMKWKWNGTTIGNDFSLWTTSGTVSPYPTGA